VLELPEDYQDLLREFVMHEVEFLLVGGWAVGIPYGSQEILTQISGVDFDEARAEATWVDAGDLRIPVIGRSALLINKRAAGRSRDLADVETLEGPDSN